MKSIVIQKNGATGAISIYVDGVLQTVDEHDWGVPLLGGPRWMPYRGRRHGACMETLERRARYGGRKGRRARRRLQTGEYVTIWRCAVDASALNQSVEPK